MSAEILCIGTELLIGDIVNTNATYISRALSYHGIDVLYHTACGDNPARMKECFLKALSRSELVITTGGLGPTYDDITKSVCAEALGLRLVKSDEIKQSLCDYFERTGRVMTENNLSQAFIPEGAHVFPNEYGTAPGLCVQKDGKTVVMLPGPPREMKPLLDEQVIPYLSQFTDKVLVSSNVNIFGIGESSVDERLHELMQSSENPTVAPYIDDGEVRLRVTASAKSETQAKELIKPTVEKIKAALGGFVYGVDAGSLENALVCLLKQKGLTVATAESCTGGLISQKITSVAGASEVFGFGVCTYANAAKIELLGVSEKTLEEYGAVSEQTAVEMARGAKRLSGADIAISVTGLAGPGGGTAQKPVGLVYIGTAYKDKAFAKRFELARHSKSDRAFIRTLAAKNALKAAIDAALEF